MEDFKSSLRQTGTSMERAKEIRVLPQGKTLAGQHDNASGFAHLGRTTYVSSRSAKPAPASQKHRPRAAQSSRSKEDGEEDEIDFLEGANASDSPVFGVPYHEDFKPKKLPDFIKKKSGLEAVTALPLTESKATSTATSSDTPTANNPLTPFSISSDSRHSRGSSKPPTSSQNDAITFSSSARTSPPRSKQASRRKPVAEKGGRIRTLGTESLQNQAEKKPHGLNERAQHHLEELEGLSDLSLAPDKSSQRELGKSTSKSRLPHPNKHPVDDCATISSPPPAKSRRRPVRANKLPPSESESSSEDSDSTDKSKTRRSTRSQKSQKSAQGRSSSFWSALDDVASDSVVPKTKKKSPTSVKDVTNMDQSQSSQFPKASESPNSQQDAHSSSSFYSALKEIANTTPVRAPRKQEFDLSYVPLITVSFLTHQHMY